MGSNLFYIAIIILSKLSCDRLFAVQLKKNYRNDIGFTRIPIFIGTHIDLLFIVFLNGMVDSFLKSYFSYQNNLLAILHNVAPFAKDLCPITTALLIQTITTAANPKVLRQDKNNLLILRKTMNLIHKILCYQPETCINLLYELLAQKKELECLKQLPLKKIYAPKQPPKQENQQNKEANIVTNKNKEENKSVEPKSDNQNKSPIKAEEEEEEEKTSPFEKKPEEGISKVPQTGQQNANAGLVQVQLFDSKWMQIYAHNLANDLIFYVADYLQEQLSQTLREKLTNSEEEVKTFLNEQSILGIVPQPGPIIVEVVNDPDNINNNLFLFLWQQIFLKNQGLPYIDTQDVKLLNVSQPKDS